ncbi:MAG: hypothetical protein NTU69_01520 [Proteobacteria bacterium]|nr:hypothetical protein [Pseudomonadota bacterium]
MNKFLIIRRILICVFLISMVSTPLYGKDDKLKPKEFGVYIKTQKALQRLMPNIVFDENGTLFIETNNPPHFLLKDIEYFVVYGKYDIKVLTMNPLLFIQQSPLGKARFVFGKDVGFEVKKKGDDLYTVKPKELMGRGYFCLWINDSAWDFIVE